MLDRAPALALRYASHVRALALVAIVACSAPPKAAPAPAAPAEAKRDLAVAEPAPKKPATEPQPPGGLNLVSRDELIVRGRFQTQPQDELDVAERDLWAPCVREFVQAQQPHARRALTAAFARHAVTCDDHKRIVIAPPHDYRGTSYVAYRGAFGDLAFEVVVCGVDEFDSASLAYDGKRWRSGASDRVDVCAIASTPDVRTIRRMLRDAVDARDVVLHVDGIEDVVITEQRKRDLRLVLDALDALGTR